MDARDWDERYRAVTEPWGVDPAGTVATRISDLRPGTAIDLACGDGRHARWMAGQGWSVTAVDYSSVAIDLARASDGGQGCRLASRRRDRVAAGRAGRPGVGQLSSPRGRPSGRNLEARRGGVADARRTGPLFGGAFHRELPSWCGRSTRTDHSARYFRSHSRCGGIEGLCPRTCRSAARR